MSRVAGASRPGRRARRAQTRSALVALLAVLAVAALALAAWPRGGGYELRARFANASQLVEQAVVQVAGRRVGTVTDLRLADDGTAEATLRIGDDALAPLHAGTRAEIRTVGQAGVTSRFVELSPGSRSAPELPDGAVLPVSATRGVVDLDEVLNAVDAPARADVREFVRRAADVYAGSGARSFNRMLARLDPALAETTRLFGELEADGEDLERLIARGATAATAIAQRRPDLRSAVTGTARALGAVAERRAELAGILDGAPAVLAQAGGTLAGVSRTSARLRPALREVPAAARPLRDVATAIPPVLDRATPVVGQLRGELPRLRRTLVALPALRGPLEGALTDTGAALDRGLPVLKGLRYYGPDFILGVLNGLAGVAVGNYNELGHYARLEFVQSPQTLLGGALSPLLPTLTQASILGIFRTRTHLDARCPGSTAPPARDGSSPWVPDPSICDPADSMPASVNEP